MNRNKKNRQIILMLVTFIAVIISINTSHTEEIPLMKIQEVTDLIMSPGCDYIYTLTLCPSSEAAQMRELVKDKLLRGESKEQILDYFEQVYGPRILAQPSKKGFYFVAWWFPYFLLVDTIILAGVILYIWRRRAQKRTISTVYGSTVNSEVDKELDKMLEAEVQKLREE